MKKSNPIYPNTIHQYAIQQMFTNTSFNCVSNYGYVSSNVLMTWWTYSELNKPLAQHAKLFGFYDVVKKLFNEARNNPNPTDKCYNINYVRKSVVLSLDYKGDLVFNRENSYDDVEIEVVSCSMIFTPTHVDFVPMLITVFSNNIDDKAYKAIDEVALYTAHIVNDYVSCN